MTPSVSQPAGVASPRTGLSPAQHRIRRASDPAIHPADAHGSLASFSKEPPSATHEIATERFLGFGLAVARPMAECIDALRQELHDAQASYRGWLERRPARVARALASSSEKENLKAANHGLQQEICNLQEQISAGNAQLEQLAHSLWSADQQVDGMQSLVAQYRREAVRAEMAQERVRSEYKFKESRLRDEAKMARLAHEDALVQARGDLELLKRDHAQQVAAMQKELDKKTVEMKSFAEAASDRISTLTTAKNNLAHDYASLCAEHQWFLATWGLGSIAPDEIASDDEERVTIMVPPLPADPPPPTEDSAIVPHSP